MKLKRKANQALDELFELIKTPDHTPYFPDKIRKEKLEQWINRWICEEKTEQLVLDKKYLTSDFLDAIKYKLASDLAEKLIEGNCGEFQVEERRVIATLTGMKKC